MAKPTDYTLYSGGHVGAESFFGECAEKWGVQEVTFSFDGHYIKREKNVVMLSEKDLCRGDISMEIVSMHMHRKYSNSEKIKSVLQSIFHMVHKSEQIFAIGEIQADNTVKGGTGWAVELGKFFNRDVHVFDKTVNKWFTWMQAEWREDEPVISRQAFCGTGSRNLSEGSQKAILALYERSFDKKL
ncbi:hypothetical protein CHISP_1677 [Chitinispirillum alkaliphilum]|nr:hypothetical protein CHISP_1677 [Chitinispirillum alkaliphilum]